MLHYLRHHRSKLDEKESIGIEPLIHQNAFKKTLHFSSYDVQSSMRHDEPDTLDLEYTRTMMAGLMFHSDPRKLGMVGLGGGSLAKFCHRHLPAAQMEVAEISKAVIALRREFHIPEDSDRFKVLHSDGSKFVAQRPDSFDLLFVDGFDAKGLPERLCSQEFYDDCQAALRTRGIFVANLPIDDPRYGDCTARLRRAFAGSVLAVEDGESQNSIVFASKGAAFERYPRNVVRAPTYLDGIAMGQLRAGFALVASALEDHRC